jgi:hypothetical protein
VHLQVIHFQLAGPTGDDYLALCDRLAPTFGDVPGLLAMVWLADPASRMYGGVYLWWDREAMKRFARSELFAALAATAQAADVHSADFPVLDGPTRVTLGLLAPRRAGVDGERHPASCGPSTSLPAKPADDARVDG